MSLLGLKETLDRLARASRVRWYRHVLRRDNCGVLRRMLDFEVAEKRVGGRPNMTWKNLLTRLDRKRKMPITEQRGLTVFTNFQET